MGWFSKKRSNTFGQEYKNAVGYDDRWAAICYENNAKLGYNTTEEKYSFRLKVVENSSDYNSLCDVLDISSSEVVSYFIRTFDR
jgi:hypothetical protein